MKYKVTIDGDENGYTQNLYIDDKLVYGITWERTDSGAKATSEEPKQDSLPDELYELVDEIEGGLDLMRYAEENA